MLETLRRSISPYYLTASIKRLSPWELVQRFRAKLEVPGAIQGKKIPYLAGLYAMFLHEDGLTLLEAKILPGSLQILKGALFVRPKHLFPIL